MERISWCLNKKKGIHIVEPNFEISREYLKRAKSDAEQISKQNNTWKTIIAYYACYNALYSVLTRYGIRSEIHSCTIELIKLFEKLRAYNDFMTELKNKRNNTQYYLKSEDINICKIMEFIAICEQELHRCNQKNIDKIIKLINNIKNEKIKL